MKKRISTLVLILAAFVFFSTGCRKNENLHGTLTDVEGNTYNTIKTGSQEWMAENLKTTLYNDGTEIPLIQDAVDWGNLTTSGYCWYNNDPSTFRETYGALYNGYTIETGKLCPAGWHVPETREWRILREFLGDSAKAGGKLKEVGTAHWLTPNKGANNSSELTALPAGIRYFEGTFSSIYSYTGIWSATEASQDEMWFTSLYFADAAFIMDHRNKKYGFSVRCLKD